MFAKFAKFGKFGKFGKFATFTSVPERAQARSTVSLARHTQPKPLSLPIGPGTRTGVPSGPGGCGEGRPGRGRVVRGWDAGPLPVKMLLLPSHQKFNTFNTFGRPTLPPLPVLMEKCRG
jgi:hypothetical protein